VVDLPVTFRLLYIPSKLFVHGNATATASNIAAHEVHSALMVVLGGLIPATIDFLNSFPWRSS
jgi:hypothetical protein